MTDMPSDFFALRLRHERERAEVSQTELARRIAAILGTKIDPSAVNRIEQRTRTVRLDEAVAAAQALELPLAVLLTEDPAEENSHALRGYLAQLTDAEAQWDRSRAEIDRLTQAIKSLTEERILLAGASPDTPDLDPDLAAAIDARLPHEDENDDDAEENERSWSTDRAE